MKKTLQIGLLILSICTLASESKAQYYLNSAGIRIGGSYGLTYKKFFNQSQAFELLLGGRHNGMHVTGTFQFNKPLNLSKNETFFLYYGGGGHIGFQDYNTKILDSQSDYRYENQTYFSMGIDVIMGVEYRFLTAPITIGLDLKPYFSFIGFRYTTADFWDTSLSVKYTF